MSSNIKNNFIKEIWARRVPHILGTYAISASAAILFLDWAVIRYSLNNILTDILFIIIITILPSICMIAYYHGKPGKDEWQKIEIVGIPTNIIFQFLASFFLFLLAFFQEIKIITIIY